jgi:hypothetical protein
VVTPAVVIILFQQPAAAGLHSNPVAVGPLEAACLLSESHDARGKPE